MCFNNTPTAKVVNQRISKTVAVMEITEMEQALLNLLAQHIHAIYNSRP